MKAKLVEEISFQKTRDPKKALGLGIDKTILEAVYESYDRMDEMINDPILDDIFKANPNANIVEIKRALSIMIGEIIDTWNTGNFK